MEDQLFFVSCAKEVRNKNTLKFLSLDIFIKICYIFIRIYNLLNYTVKRNFLQILFILFYAKIALAVKVLAIVGGVAITDVDVEKRVEALKIANPGIVANDAYKKRILDELINEELFRNEAQRLNFMISEQEVNSQFKQIQQSFSIPESEINQLSKNQSLRRQVESQLLWNKMVNNIYLNRIKVSKQEIEDEKKIKKLKLKSISFKQLVYPISLQKEASQIRASNCSEFDLSAAKQGFAKPALNNVLFSDLNANFQSLIKGLADNTLSPVKGNEEYNQLIMVCSRQWEETTSNEKEIEAALSNRKMNAEAQKYLNELRRRICVQYEK